MKDVFNFDDESLLQPELIREIRLQYQLNWRGIHGIGHFLRVRENGLRVARENGALVPVVELFAFLHDARRLNDSRDPGHGSRAAELARSLHGTFFQLAPEELELLEYACRFHTDGLTEGDITVQTCWDSDRLDLGRAHIKPRASKLCTDVAKDPQVIEWAYGRSLAG